MPLRHEPPVGLRFDKVAMRVINRLKVGLGGDVPPGTTVLVAITAPIRLPSKTAAAVEAKARTLLARNRQSRDARFSVHGNRVRIRVVRNGPARAAKVIGFVHNADVDVRKLLDTASTRITRRTG